MLPFISYHTPIFTLPDETLGRILVVAANLVLDEDRRWKYVELRSTQPRHVALVLARVCRRFNRIAIPMLYADIAIDIRFGTTASLLYQTLKSNPSLRPFCRALKIRGICSGVGETNKNMARDILTWLAWTKSFHLVGHDLSPEADSLAILRLALEKMPELTEIGVNGICRGHSKLDIALMVSRLSKLDCSSLKTLDLSGISKEISYDALAYLKSVPGAASFTEMKIFCFLQTPEVLNDLLRWPAKLERLTFKYSFQQDYGGYGLFREWQLGALTSLLYVHKESLRYLEVTHLNHQGLRNVDLSSFSRLKTLCLSSRVTGDDPSLIAGLVAPQLEMFQWDFTLEDQQCSESFDFFGQKEEDWVRAFAAAFVARKAPLREIRVLAHPSEEFWSSPDEGEEPKYPWDRLDDISRDLETHGIVVTYDDPTVTREEFKEIVRETRESYLTMLENHRNGYHFLK